ncbi:hypothetical protein [Fervidobacterium sp.]|uniref:hypothetical protein n=1 Tax=Fervidobacterium sp. TaxID=1871331 RepID=UPI0025C0025F|nr:hypothetical protein [Fervidobacterium sp.]
MIGILVFLLSLINNGALNSLYFGLIAWGAIIIIWIGIGFTSEEYYKRKKKIKKLTSDKYAFLDKQGFKLHEDLYFEGIYNGFFFRVLPMTKWIEKGRGRGKNIEYVVIESFYAFESDSIDKEREEKMSGDYFLGNVHFSDHCAGFVPKDWENPDFKENFDGLISIFKRENLIPLMKEEWENTFGEKLRKAKDEEENAKTKQLLKIGKLDFKYKKPDKKVSR